MTVFYFLCLLIKHVVQFEEIPERNTKIFLSLLCLKTAIEMRYLWLRLFIDFEYLELSHEHVISCGHFPTNNLQLTNNMIIKEKIM